MLSHPLLADLIELEFVPVVINNRGDRGSIGENDEVLELYSEPRLNNPVVRFVDSAGEVTASELETSHTRTARWLRARHGCVCICSCLRLSADCQPASDHYPTDKMD